MLSNIPIKYNYYKKYQDNCRTIQDVPQYVAVLSIFKDSV